MAVSLMDNLENRIKLILSLENPFDYKEYEGKALIPLSKGGYAQKTGMLMCAISEFPNEEPREAYLKFIDNMNKEHDKEVPKQSREECGSCDKKRRVR